MKNPEQKYSILGADWGKYKPVDTTRCVTCYYWNKIGHCDFCGITGKCRTRVRGKILPPAKCKNFKPIGNQQKTAMEKRRIINERITGRKRRDEN